MSSLNKINSIPFFQQKRLPLAPQLVSSLAPVCQKGGEGEIYLRSLPSLPTLPSLEDGGPVREISLPHGLPVTQTTQVRDPRVLPKVAEIVQQLTGNPSQSHLAQLKQQLRTKLNRKKKIHLHKSWLTTT